MSGQLSACVIAIDWSGAPAAAAHRRGRFAAVGARMGGEKHAQATDARRPALFHQLPCDLPPVQLRGGRLRAEVEHWLLDFALRREPVVAGLDFSFSYPAWFLRELGCGSAPELWALAAAEGERWLREPHPHFWGRRKGIGPPPEHRAPGSLGYRQCERAAVVKTGRLPLSSFQIGGAGAVGTGTLRGLPMLARLRAAGWSVWPFDPPRLPMVSALAMREHAASFASLTQAQDETTRLEGAIWRPPPGVNKQP